MLDSVKNRPSDDLLKQYAPLEDWEEAIKQAKRSTFKRHRTGAVIIDYRGTIRGKGCSHKRDGYKANSMHAEQHALGSFYKHATLSCVCIIVTLTKVDNFAGCSRPCYDCARALQTWSINALYAEQTNEGDWAIRQTAFDLLTEGYLKPTRYA